MILYNTNSKPRVNNTVLWPNMSHKPRSPTADSKNMGLCVHLRALNREPTTYSPLASMVLCSIYP